MKLALFDDYIPAVLVGDEVVDITAEVNVGRSGQETMEAIIESWGALRPALVDRAEHGERIPLDSVRLRAPLPRPGKIMCMIANFRESESLPPLPINGFLVASESVLDPGGTAVLPPHQFDICHHEAELVAVIGKGGRDIPAAIAMEHVFGYTSGVDISARSDWEFLGKSYDGFKPLGPCIVTADEIADPHALNIRLAVDGQPRQDFNMSLIAHRLEECIAFFSSIMTLKRGDVLFLGTHHLGLGPLQDGDSVEMNIDGIPALRFEVSDPSGRSWPKGVDPAAAPFIEQMMQDHADRTASE